MTADRRAVLLGGLAAGLACATPAPAASEPAMILKPDREAMIPVAGGRVYVRVNGDLAGPRPPIVLIHGGPGSSHWYFLPATALADDRAVILYDQLDSGRSDHPDDPANWRVARFVGELEAIRAHLGVPRWHVLGASWGGTVALEYAATRPPHLASAILQSPLVSTARWIEDARLLRDTMPPAIRDALARCEAADSASDPACTAAIDAFYRRYVTLRDADSALAGYRDGLPRSFTQSIYRHMWGPAEFAATGTLKTYDGSPLLDRLDGARTLFVAGEADEARPATVSAFARQAGARFAMIPDAAHTIMLDNPRAYVPLIRHWCAEHDA